MKERIEQIIRAKNLSATEFAMKLGIQPSSVSHLLAGRNNPSLDFVKKLKETFPEYNLDWLIFGKGPVTVSEPFKENESSFDLFSVKNKEENSTMETDDFNNSFGASESLESISAMENLSQKFGIGLKSIILVYQDNCFEVIHPK